MSTSARGTGTGTESTDVRKIDFTDLAARLDGDLVTPADPRWDTARTGWLLNADQRPVAVALAATAADVATVVHAASRAGLRVAAQGTGHSAATLAPNLDDTILIRTGALDAVTIDPVAATARAEAGAIWVDVSDRAAVHGLAALAGSSPDVGVTGYTLGGGLSWLGRRYGLATNSVLAAEVVTGDGQILRIDAEHHPELFWALRGGGGSVALVTALEFRLYPVTEVYAGAMFWPLERATEVLTTWQRWTEDAPDDVTSCGRLLNFPSIPDVPEPLRGQSFAVVEIAYLGDADDGAALIAPLRELQPVIDMVATIPAAGLAKMHMDPEVPVPGVGDGFPLASLPPEAIDALVAVAGAGSRSPLLSVEMRHLGGALSRAPRDAGVGATIPGAYAGFAVGLTPDPAMEQLVYDRVVAVQQAMAPWKADRSYPNFAEHPDHPIGFFSAADQERLARVRQRYDAAGTLVSGHTVPTK